MLFVWKVIGEPCRTSDCSTRLGGSCAAVSGLDWIILSGFWFHFVGLIFGLFLFYFLWNILEDLGIFEYFFGEDQGRYLIEIDKENLEKSKKILKENNVHYELIGITQKKNIELSGEIKINIKFFSIY